MRQLTDKEKVSILRRLTGGWEQIFNDAVDVFDRSEFVSSDAPRSPIGVAVRSLTRFNCRRWARADKSNFRENINAANENICGEYLDSLGEKPTSGTLEVGGVPGSCPVPYSLTWVIGSYDEVRCDNGTRTSFPAGETLTTTVTGPVDSLAEEDVLGSCGPTGIAGTRVLVGLNGSPPAQVLIAQTSFPSTIYIDNYSGGTLSLARVDGLPDTCEVAPQYEPPNIPTGLLPLPPTINIDVPGVGPVDITVEFDDQGRPVVCIPALELCATVNVPFGNDDSPPGAGDLGEPGADSETGSGEEAEGEAQEGEVLVGLNVEILSSPPSANKFTPDVFRGVAYIYMGNEELKSLHFAGSTMKSSQFVFAETDNLTHWQVAANAGYNLKITPHYREVEV